MNDTDSKPMGTFRQRTTENNNGLQLNKYINFLNHPSFHTASHCFLLAHSKDVIFKLYVLMQVCGKTVQMRFRYHGT